MNIKPDITRDYGKKTWFGGLWKQSQTNPISNGMRGFLSITQEIATALRASQWHQDLCCFVPLRQSLPWAESNGLRACLVALWLRANLKKQSQFLKGQNDVKLILAMVYGNFHRWRRLKNKAKQSQFAKYLDRPHGGGTKERCKIMDFAL